MFRKIKRIILRFAMARQLRELPKPLRERMLDVVTENQAFFEGMNREIKERVSRGEDKTIVAQAVALKHQAELQRLLQGK